MIPTPAPPLSQGDLLRLDRFLHSAACGGDAMGLSRAHGFLTAAASGPEALEPEAWIRLVFDEPVFANGEQAQDMLGLALRLYQDIERSLAVEDGFHPVLEYVRGEHGAMQADAAAWCQGFVSGMSLCRKHWSWHAGGPLGTPLEIIFRLSRSAPGRDTGYARLCDALPPAAQAIWRYWRAEAANA